MDAKTKTKLVNMLMTRYVKLYENRYGKKPVFNRNTERWAFGYLLEDLGHEALPALEYYFTLKRSLNSSDFLKNYHEINQWRQEDEEDRVLRMRLAEKTKRRVEEQRRNGVSGTSDN